MELALEPQGPEGVTILGGPSLMGISGQAMNKDDIRDWRIASEDGFNRQFSAHGRA